MRILIAEGMPGRVRPAATLYPDHRFLFCGDASEAMARMDDADGLVTDLFFPRQEGRPIEGLLQEYLMSITPIDENAADEMAQLFSSGRHLLPGSIQEAVDSAAACFGRRPHPYLENHGCYGSLLMMKAEERGMPAVLVADVYDGLVGEGSVAALVLLAPLMIRGILAMKDIEAADGSRLVSSIPQERTDRPALGEEALQKLLGQE